MIFVTVPRRTPPRNAQPANDFVNEAIGIQPSLLTKPNGHDPFGATPHVYLAAPPATRYSTAAATLPGFVARAVGIYASHFTRDCGRGFGARFGAPG